MKKKEKKKEEKKKIKGGGGCWLFHFSLRSFLLVVHEKSFVMPTRSSCVLLFWYLGVR